LSGLKVIGPAKHYAAVVEALGGTSLSFPIQEYYETIQRGTASGVVTGWTAFPSFKLAEVTTYHVDTSLGTAAAMIFMSKKRFDALPPAVQKVLLDNSGEALSQKFGKFWDQVNDGVRTMVSKQPGHTVVELTPDQTAAWRQKIEPANDKVINALPNGRKFVEAFRKEQDGFKPAM
jgi:TRAP-type C4-dicarboxylate transport system substrate-binding protein